MVLATCANSSESLGLSNNKKRWSESSPGFSKIDQEEVYVQQEWHGQAANLQFLHAEAHEAPA